MIHIWTADGYESDKWSSQWISNLSNWNKEAWKKKASLFQLLKLEIHCDDHFSLLFVMLLTNTMLCPRARRGSVSECINKYNYVINKNIFTDLRFAWLSQSGITMLLEIPNNSSQLEVWSFLNQSTRSGPDCRFHPLISWLRDAYFLKTKMAVRELGLLSLAPSAQSCAFVLFVFVFASFSM